MPKLRARALRLQSSRASVSSLVPFRLSGEADRLFYLSKARVLSHWVEQRVVPQPHQPRVAQREGLFQLRQGVVLPAPLGQHLGLLIVNRIATFLDQFGIISLSLCRSPELHVDNGEPPEARCAIAFFCSVLLHCGVDLALHHDDAHRHFFPLSDWRYASPVSYWDPRRLGRLGALLEVCSVIGGSFVLARRGQRSAPGLALAGLSALYLGAYLYAYWL